MHASSTTRELAAFISRPALRVMEGVARQLGVRLPEETSVASTHEIQETSASTPGTLTPESTSAMPVPPGVSRPAATRSAATAFTPAQSGSPAAPRVERAHASSSEPNASRAGLRGAVPSAARIEAPRIQTEATGARTRAPAVSEPQPPPRVEIRGVTPDAPTATTGTAGQASPARAPAPASVTSPFRAPQAPLTHAATPLASEAAGESSSGPTASRIELHGPVPGAVSQETSRPTPSSAAPAERSTRVVRLLSGAHFQAQASAPSGATATFRAQQSSVTHTAPPAGSEASDVSSSGPTVPRIELHGAAPLVASEQAPHAPGAVSQQLSKRTRVVRLLSGAHFQAQASAPADAPATFRAQQSSVTHTAPPPGSEASDASSSGPTVPRIELHGPVPGAISQEASRPAPPSAASAERSRRVVRLFPGAHFQAQASAPSGAPASFRAQQDPVTPPAPPPGSEASEVSSSGPTVPRIELHGPAPLAASEVRPLSGAHPLTGQAHATVPSEQVPAAAHSSTGPGASPQPARSTPSRTRLTFLPAPEAPSPSIPMSPSPSGPARSASPLPGAPGLIQQLTRAVTPFWEQAQPRTHAAPAVERASPSSHQVKPSSGAAGRDTSNGNVPPAPSAPRTDLDRRSLEDALVDILRETARRHGVEV